jgi:hypothetical protein
MEAETVHFVAGTRATAAHGAETKAGSRYYRSGFPAAGNLE